MKKTFPEWSWQEEYCYRQLKKEEDEKKNQEKQEEQRRKEKIFCGYGIVFLIFLLFIWKALGFYYI